MNEPAITQLTITQALEAHFNRILNTHMAGMPVVNPDLQVEAVEFRQWNQYTLCVMITPWFMSFFLFPEEASAAQQWKTGSTHHQSFPSGVYEFTAAQDEELGPYQSCALFSPMFEFSSQAMAREAAKASMLALMDESTPADSDQENARQIEQHWHGEATATDQDNQESVQAAKPMSRRDLFKRVMRSGKND